MRNHHSSPDRGAVSPNAPSFGYRSYVLAVLVTVYTFNFIDRQIVGILAIPIKAELRLTDTQLGLMGGLAFALFYTFLGIPIARLADRVSRIGIMTLALTLWSLMTAACGLTHSFAQLFLARLGVGVGEAGGVAPAYSLLCDYFPARQRARALSVYSFGIPIGSAAGIVIGGFITSWMNWRTAFFVVGAAGLVLAPLLKWTVREPVRGGYDEPVGGGQRIGVQAAGKQAVASLPTVDRAAAQQAAGDGAITDSAVGGRAITDRAADDPAAGEDRPSLLAVMQLLARKPSFWGLSLGSASASMMGYGLFFWMPSFLVRSFSLTLIQASLAYGGLILIGGLIGIWLGGAIADRYGQRHKAAYALIPAIAFVATLPFYITGVTSTTIGFGMAVLLVPTALGLMWLGPVLTAIQHLVPGTMRATASAIFLFINNLLGIGVGTTLIGALSDAFKVRAGVDSLRYAILSGTGFYVVAALCLFFAARKLGRDWMQ